MDMLTVFIVVIIGYLIGSISFARVFVKNVNPQADLNQARMHKSESGAEGTVSGIGASTASVALGKKYGGYVALFDMLKAFIPTLVLKFIYPEQPYELIYSILCIVGHNYPIYYRFEGGRGLSPMLGSLLAIEPIGLIVSILLGTLFAILINAPHTALIFWFPILALWSWFVTKDLTVAIYAIVLLIIFIVAEIPEMKLAWQYQKQGRMDEYTRMILDSGPQTRMMKKLTERIRFWDKKS